MTFDDLKDAVPFKTVLIDDDLCERIFVAISYEHKIIYTTYISGDIAGSVSWTEQEIKDWKIKPDHEGIRELKPGETIYYSGYTQRRPEKELILRALMELSRDSELRADIYKYILAEIK